jgi:hypothetical protein
MAIHIRRRECIFTLLGGAAARPAAALRHTGGSRLARCTNRANTTLSIPG